MNKLSVTLITKDEEQNIKRCLDSVKWADEIVLVDCGSKDKTLSIAHTYPNCNTHYIPWQGFGLQKQAAVDLTKNDWILSIDADEELSLELQNTIRETLHDPDAPGYRIRRNSFYLGRMIKHCGWNHDFPLRLFNKNHGRFNNRPVHEYVELNGDVSKIFDPLFHYTYPAVKDHIRKISFYSGLGARELFEKNKRSHPVAAFLRGMFKFIKMYFLQMGFLDGKEGLILACLSGFGVSLKYLKLWEMNRSG